MRAKTEMKRGFTIVELIMVIGIIGVLMSIVLTSSASSIRLARRQRAHAMRSMILQGIEAYRAQYGQWPVEPGEGDDRDNGRYTYSADEANDMIRAVVSKTKENNPLLDASSLFVSTRQGEPGSLDTGMDFLMAVRGTKKTKKIKLSQMKFGYPETQHGRFRRFVIQYNPESDNMSIRLQTSQEEKRRRVMTRDENYLAEESDE